MGDELIEKLAAIEHERWADWQKWMIGSAGTDTTPRYKFNEDGSITIPAVLIKAWRRQINTSYKDLTDNEKQSDRDQVMRYWPLIQEHTAQAVKEAYDRGWDDGNYRKDD